MTTRVLSETKMTSDLLFERVCGFHSNCEGNINISIAVALITPNSLIKILFQQIKS